MAGVSSLFYHIPSSIYRRRLVTYFVSADSVNGRSRIFTVHPIQVIPEIQFTYSKIAGAFLRLPTYAENAFSALVLRIEEGGGKTSPPAWNLVESLNYP
jgi:hypothetical protein